MQTFPQNESIMHKENDCGDLSQVKILKVS